jgi:hypothetical protein
VVALQPVPDGVEEVCLSETHASVQEEGIVVFARLECDLFGDGSSEPVALADNKRVKGVLTSKNGSRPIFRPRR